MKFRQPIIKRISFVTKMFKIEQFILQKIEKISFYFT